HALEEAARARALRAADAQPVLAPQLLEHVLLPAAPGPDLTPERGAGLRPLLDRQRELKRLVRRLLGAGEGEHAALPAADVGLVLDEVVDQEVDARREVGAHRGLAHVERLPRRRDAEELVGWVRLVPVLGQPDPRLLAEG